MRSLSEITAFDSTEDAVAVHTGRCVGNSVPQPDHSREGALSMPVLPGTQPMTMLCAPTIETDGAETRTVRCCGPAGRNYSPGAKVG